MQHPKALPMMMNHISFGKAFVKACGNGRFSGTSHHGEICNSDQQDKLEFHLKIGFFSLRFAMQCTPATAGKSIFQRGAFRPSTSLLASSRAVMAPHKISGRMHRSFCARDHIWNIFYTLVESQSLIPKLAASSCLFLSLEPHQDCVELPQERTSVSSFSSFHY